MWPLRVFRLRVCECVHNCVLLCMEADNQNANPRGNIFCANFATMSDESVVPAERQDRVWQQVRISGRCITECIVAAIHAVAAAPAG